MTKCYRFALPVILRSIATKNLLPDSVAVHKVIAQWAKEESSPVILSATALVSSSFPRVFSGNPGEIRTGPPIKAFGGDGFAFISARPRHLEQRDT